MWDDLDYCITPIIGAFEYNDAECCTNFESSPVCDLQKTPLPADKSAHVPCCLALHVLRRSLRNEFTECCECESSLSDNATYSILREYYENKRSRRGEISATNHSVTASFVKSLSLADKFISRSVLPVAHDGSGLIALHLHVTRLGFRQKKPKSATCWPRPQAPFHVDGLKCFEFAADPHYFLHSQSSLPQEKAEMLINVGILLGVNEFRARATRLGNSPTMNYSAD